MSTPKKKLEYTPSPWTGGRRTRPRADSLGEMDVNARDQIASDETGEMMHKSDRSRNKQLLDDLRPDPELERLNKQHEAEGSGLSYGTTGRFRGARADAFENPNDIDEADVESPTVLPSRDKAKALGDYMRLQGRPIKKE